LLRVDADYHLNIMATQSRYQKMIAYHETIIELLESSSSG